MISAPPGELDADSPAEPPDMHTWVVVGDAPSNGKGKRVSLHCTACEAVVNLRQRAIRNGALHACRCSGGVPAIYKTKPISEPTNRRSTK